MSYLFEGQRITTPLNIVSNQPEFTADTVSLKRLTVSQQAQRWELQFALEPTHDGGDLLSSLTAGSVAPKTMIMPQVLKSDTTLQVVDAVPVVGVSADAGDIVITVGVDTGDNDNVFTIGTFIKFANHDKIYILTSDATVVAGVTTLNIYPALLTDTPSTTVFVHKDDVDLTYMLDTNTMKGISFVNGVVAKVGQISVVEQL